MANALERLYEGIGNVVLRDSDGKPSIFVKHQKQYSDEFDSALPHTIHPAFQCGEGVVDDAVLWAKYLPTQLTQGGAYYSLPNAVPVWNQTYPQMNTAAKAFGNTTLMTIADYGLLVLMHHKKGIAFNVYGNNAHGANLNDGTQYEVGQSVVVGNERTFAGYLWKCLKAHTTSADHLPTEAPGYWEKIKKVGGTCPPEELSHRTSGYDYQYADWYQGRRTLTGSGPLNWYLFDDIGNEADMGSMLRYVISDLQIVNGEILVIPYNQAGDKSCNTYYSGSSPNALYKAILPSANDNSYTFVSPGTSGTVHYDKNSSGLYLKAGAASGSGSASCTFKDMPIDNESLPYVPSILYELGLAPIPGTKLDHRFVVTLGQNDYMPYVGTTFEGSTTKNLEFRYNNGWNASYPNSCRQRARVPAST